MKRTKECIDFINKKCKFVTAQQRKIDFKTFAQFATDQDWLYTPEIMSDIEINDICFDQAEGELDAKIYVRPINNDVTIKLLV